MSRNDLAPAFIRVVGELVKYQPLSLGPNGQWSINPTQHWLVMGEVHFGYRTINRRRRKVYVWTDEYERTGWAETKVASIVAMFESNGYFEVDDDAANPGLFDGMS